MLWIAFPILAALAAALSNFTDNFIIDTAMKRRNPAALQLTYVISYVLIVILILSIFGPRVFGIIPFSDVLLLATAGVINAFASLPWYHAMRSDETFDVTLFLQSAPLISLVLGVLVLGQQITPGQSLAFTLIMTAIMIIVFTTRAPRQSNKINIQSALLVTAACLIWVVSDVLFVLGANHATTDLFVSSFAYYEIGCIIGIFVLMLTRRRWLYQLRSALTGPHWHYSFFVVGSNLINVGQNVLIKIGLVLAPTIGILSATSRVSLLFFTFALGIILTKIWPQFGREKLSRRILLAHLVALFLAVIGVILLNT
jgi:drug/metabolite transporter (DMT)-like permease